MLLSEVSRPERIVILTVRLLQGHKLRTCDMADELNTSRRTIQRDMMAISRQLPIFFDNGQWVHIEDGEPVLISPY